MIKIPYRLEDRLKSSRTEYNKVSNLFSSISELMSAHTDFFPEYTNHGIPHVQTMLNLADQLIPDKTLCKLRPEDICFLICAVTIHDLGMFLSVDGVQELLHGSWQNRKTRNLDKLSWAEAWESYKSEVRRFSDEKMLSAFGELIDVNNIQTDIQKMQRGDFLIIGEFLRRFHPRLSHDIAMYGFPGSEEISILPNEFSPPHRKLIGLLARSHGMTLRKTEGYVKELGSAKKPCNCPAFYLMAVLRIADLLDAGKHRAPEVLQKRQAMFIPISQQEWTWNQQVDMNNYAWDQDAGTLTIVGEPESSTQFVRLKDWLEYIQQELDLCWAVISEKYGAEYSLSIHRVESPILDPENETYRDQFLAKEAKLRANPALLKHLVAPLYGDDPSYGVRELVQNAVDACLERENIEKKRGNTSYTGQVIVRVDTEKATFTIEDNGIGMNEDVLLNYYLSAGSSYRYSDSWAQNHAPDGKSQVARTGKFGVGFLAVFLLGYQVNVTTRHMDDDLGYQFQFGMEPVQLDIMRVPCPQGTTIEINLTADALQKLIRNTEWQHWYVFDIPVLEFFLNGSTVKPNTLVDDENAFHWLFQDADSSFTTLHRNEANNGWFEIESDTYEKFLWSFDESAKFFCNGFRIHNFQAPVNLYDIDPKIPKVSVSLIDPHSCVNMDMSRNTVLGFPESDQLLGQVYRYWIAELLLSDWQANGGISRNLTRGFEPRFFKKSADLAFNNIEFSTYLCSRNGFMLNQASSLLAANMKRIIALGCDSIALERALTDARNLFPAHQPFTIIPLSAVESPFFNIFTTNSTKKENTDKTAGAIRNFIDWLTASSTRNSFFENPPKDYSAKAINVCIHKEFYSSIPSLSKWKYTLDNAQEEGNMYKWVVDLANIKDCPYRGVVDMLLRSYGRTRDISSATSDVAEQLKDFTLFIDFSKLNSEQFPVIIECAVDTKLFSKQSLFAKILKELLIPAPDFPRQDMWIPYDMEEREMKFPKAFEELKPYMDHIKQHTGK